MITKLADILNIYNFLFLGDSYSSALTEQINNTVNTVQNSNFQVVIQLINYIGEGILFLFATIGTLYGIYKKNILAYTWSIFAIIIFALISIGTFISLPLLLGDRLFTICWATSMIYLCALGADYLIKKLGKKMVYIMILLLLILPTLCFSSISTGSETSLLNSDKVAIKFYDKNSEIQSLSWIEEKIPVDTKIYTSESWLPNYVDKNHEYNDFIMTGDKINTTYLKQNEYLVIKDRYFEDGMRVRMLSEYEQIKQTESGNLTLTEASNQRFYMVKLNSSTLPNLDNNKNNIFNDTIVKIYN